MDEREKAKRQKNGDPLPTAPKPKERGTGSPLGHLVAIETPEGRVVLTTVSGQPSQGRRTGKA